MFDHINSFVVFLELGIVDGWPWDFCGVVLDLIEKIFLFGDI
jgi:hypothetical protein